jgi:hypothetical protein
MINVSLGICMLVDPWLVGKLTFADQEWLYKGIKMSKMPDIQEIAQSTDFILLSQAQCNMVPCASFTSPSHASLAPRPCLNLSIVVLVTYCGVLIISTLVGFFLFETQQGLPDHTHIQTLKQLPKHIPVVSSPSGSTICKDLGFTDVQRSVIKQSSCAFLFPENNLFYNGGDINTLRRQLRA